MFIGKYNKSLIITYIGVAFALVGINCALDLNLKYAMICLVFAGICDLFDGKVARMCNTSDDEKLFGIQIDSLADMVGFVVFPCIIGYSIGLNNWYHIIGYVLLVLAGITRLGFFNITAAKGEMGKPVKAYSGLPVTTTAIIIPLLWTICTLCSNANFEIVFTCMTYVVAFLFVANIKIPKPRGIAYIVIGVIAFIALIAMFLI